jgi:nitrogen fixation protein
MEYEITHLPKDKWKGTVIPIGYTTGKYYDIHVSKTDRGFTIGIEKKDFEEPVTHTPEEHAFPTVICRSLGKCLCLGSVS